VQAVTVHVGQITSEVTATGSGADGGGSGSGGDESVWEERCRIEAVVDRLERDRLRTATGSGHD
jgi:hypothetical protein